MRGIAPLLVVSSIGLSGLAVPEGSRAFWDPSPEANVPASLAPGAKTDVFAVTDGAGGTLVFWEDERSGHSDIYAQRIDVNGHALWQEDGVPVCTAPGDQELYHSATGTTGFTPVIPDGHGGAVIAWQDGRFFSTRLNDIYCQRIDADGQVLFGANGIPVATGAGEEDQPTLCADGAGGAFVVWQDKNADPVFYDLWGQRIGPDGALLWNGGVARPLVTVDWDQDAPVLCPDGTGGAFLAWTDSRDNLNDVFAQRLGPAGEALWGPNGIAVYQHEEGQDAIAMIRSEDGDAILAWVDRRTGTSDIYAQKLAATSGAKLWGAGAKAVCTAAHSQYRPAIAGDGAAGVFVAWFDYRNAPSGPPWNLDIFAQRILADGTAAWAPNGVPVCAAPDAQRDADVWTDHQGGLFVAWEDNRGGSGREDIFAQHLNGNGQVLLEADGRAVCLVANNQERPDLLAGAGGMILAWKDDRDQLYEHDVYADRVLTAETPVIGVNRVEAAWGMVAGPVERTFQVSSVGDSGFTVESIDFARGDQGFSVDHPGSLPFELSPGEAVDLTLRFDPAAAPPGSDFADTLRIHHDAPAWASSPEVVTPVPVPASASVATVSADERVAPTRTLHVHAARPSPFSGSTNIRFQLARATRARVEVLDVRGRRIQVLADRPFRSGEHEIAWDGLDASGAAVPAGVYFLRVATDGATASRTLVRLD